MKRKLERKIPEGMVEVPAPEGVFIGSPEGRLDRVMRAGVGVFMNYASLKAETQRGVRSGELLTDLRYQIERLTDIECRLLNAEPMLLRIERLERRRQVAIRFSWMGWARRCSDAIHEQALLLIQAVMDLRARTLWPGVPELRRQPSESMLVRA